MNLKSIAIWLLIITFLALVVHQVQIRAVSLVTLFLWLAALVLSIIVFTYRKTPLQRNNLNIKEIAFLSLTSACGLVLLWYFGNIQYHFHQDEFFYAYTSYFLPPLSKLDWFAGYPPDFIAQFTIFYFIFQKPILHVLGPTIQSLRLTPWPFYIASIVYLYFLIKFLWGDRTARLAVIVYLFLAPNLYFTSLGFHHIVSTVFFVAAIYHFLKSIESPQSSHDVMAGLFSGFSFFAHPSSYITLPLILLFGLFESVRQRSMLFFRNTSRMALISAIVLLPFASHALFVHNYFFDRIGQVNIFTGSWRENSPGEAPDNTIGLILQKQFAQAFLSLVLPNLGGRDGVNFGKQALFDPYTGVLLGGGFFLLLLKIIVKKQWSYFYFLLAIVIPFLLGFVLTVHPPPFHRITLLYPLFALLVALPIETASNFKWPFRPLRLTIILVGLGVFIMTNLKHTWAMIEADKYIYPQNTRVIADYIQSSITPGTKIFIAAFPAFHVGKELFFRTGGKYIFISDNTESILSDYSGEPLILLNAIPEYLTILNQKYRTHKVFKSLYGVTLGDLTLFVP